MANILNRFTTSKNRGQTRIRFYQNSIRPIEIYEEITPFNKYYSLLLVTEQVFFVEIENFSAFDRVFVYSVKDNDGDIIYTSPLYCIPTKDSRRLHGRPKSYLVQSLIGSVPYIFTFPFQGL